MKAPNSSKDITKPWLEDVLAHYLSKKYPGKNTAILSFSVVGGTSPGDGFNSELVLLDVEVSVNEGETSRNTIILHLAAKFSSLNLMVREMNRQMKSNLREYLVYAEIIKELNEFQAAKAPEEPCIPIPELIYGKCTKKENILLMENIKITGYEAYDKYKGLDFDHLKIIIEEIARIHVLSHVYHQSSSFQEKYTCFPTTSQHLMTFKPIMSAMLETAIDFLRSQSDKEDVTERVKACKQSLIEKYTCALPEEDTIKCLIHGDMWINNIMYKYKDPQLNGSHQEIEGLKLIDWGNASWGSPFFDLQYLLHTSTTHTIRTTHLEELLHHYHSTFTRLAAKLGSPAASWNFRQFMIDWEKTCILGLLLGCSLTLGTLNTSSVVNKEQGPSVLDKSFLLPVRIVADGMKLGIAKFLASLFKKPNGESLTKKAFKLMYKPVLKELLSGKNEVMNNRVLDLFSEADKKGIFIKD
nr:uncharacterized protein LOC123757507 isoform X1 [Procambarus clarkii]XP_045597163.1 uncharacterized protein LOC123757507 isoform X1 [Procambarus clarkii]